MFGAAGIALKKPQPEKTAGEGETVGRGDLVHVAAREPLGGRETRTDTIFNRRKRGQVMKLRTRIFLSFLVAFFLVADLGWCLPPAPYTDKEMTVALDLMLRNVKSSDRMIRKDHLGRTYEQGAVVASPSFKGSPPWFTGEHDYERIWLRDSALAISALADVYRESVPGKNSLPTPATLWGIERHDIPSLFKSYLIFTDTIQNAVGAGLCDQGNSDYAHAVFSVNAEVERWSSQTDGPALRALSIMKIAELFNFTSDGVTLYVPMKNCQDMGILKRDLCYVAKSYDVAKHDLWEETPGLFFFNSMVQYEAMNRGAMFAANAKDTEFQNEMAGVRRRLEGMLGRYWRSNACQGYFARWMGDGCPITRPQCPPSGDESCLDISTILAFVHTDAHIFPLDGGMALQNADSVRKGFCFTSCTDGERQPMVRYKIDNGQNGVCAYLGRYPADCFDGAQDEASNPWVLSNHAMAQFYYKLARTILQKGGINIGPDVHPFYAFVLSPELYAALIAPQRDGRLVQDDPDIMRQVAEGLAVEGDRLVMAVRALLPPPKEVNPGASWLPEQINGESGQPWSAQDLTWSYASLLTAMLERKKLEAPLQ